MSLTDEASAAQSVELQHEFGNIVDARTLEILDRRRRTAVVKRRGWLVRRMLLTADLVGLVSALLLAEWLAPVNSADAYSPLLEIVAFLVTLPAWVVITKLYGLYDHDDERANHSTADDFGGVFHMVTVCVGLVAVVAYLSDVAHPSTQKLVIFWAFAIAFVCVGRAGARTLARRNAAYVQNTVIVGAGDVGQLVAKKLVIHPEYGMNLVGFVDAQPKERRDREGKVGRPFHEAGRSREPERRQPDERHTLDGVNLHPGPDELEESWHDVDLHVEILEGAKRLERFLVRVARERDDHPLDIEEANNRRESL